MPKLSNDRAEQVEETEDEGGYLLDPGAYFASLVSVEEKKGTAGPYWEWKYQVREDANGEELPRKSHVWDNTSLSTNALWRLKRVFTAFGVPTDTDTEDLLGEWVLLELGQETFNGRMTNKVYNVLPAAAEEEQSED